VTGLLGEGRAVGSVCLDLSKVFELSCVTSSEANWRNVDNFKFFFSLEKTWFAVTLKSVFSLMPNQLKLQSLQSSRSSKSEKAGPCGWRAKHNNARTEGSGELDELFFTKGWFLEAGNTKY